MIVGNANNSETNSVGTNVICNDADFPKLTPPKSSKISRNNGNNNANNNYNQDLASSQSFKRSTNNNGDQIKMNANGIGAIIDNGNGSGNANGSENGNGNGSGNGIGNGCGNGSATGSGSGNGNGKINENSIKNSNIGQQNDQNVTTMDLQVSQQQQQQQQHHQQHHQQQQQTNSQQHYQHQYQNQNQNHHHQHYQHQQTQEQLIFTNSNIRGGIGNSCSSSKNLDYDNCSQLASNNDYQDNQYPRTSSQNSNNSLSPDEMIFANNNNGGGGGGKSERLSKKHRTSANSKSSKPRLKAMGSSSSMDGNCTSGFISRDSSTEQYTDQSGIDLVMFFRETLNKNPTDRDTLMKIEEDLTELAHAKVGMEMIFPSTSSYNRMLIHRVAAFFGMDHNVDNATQPSVIVAVTKATRIPDIRFETLLSDQMSMDEPRKSILKRDVHSFDDSRQGYLCPDRGMLDRKSRSVEEREEEYEKARRRIFRNRETGDMCDEHYWHWSNRIRPTNNKLLKVHSLSNDPRQNGGRPSFSKAHSFGGYGGPPQTAGPPLTRGDSINSTKSAGARLLTKQDSVGSTTNTHWRLSPSSSGYKTQTPQSLRSDSVTPSPTGCGSDDHTPEPPVVQSPPPPASSCSLMWAVTDLASVPRGSILINPQTLQPIVNEDGSIYHFDPTNYPKDLSPDVYNSKLPFQLKFEKLSTSDDTENEVIDKEIESPISSQPDDDPKVEDNDESVATVECSVQTFVYPCGQDVEEQPTQDVVNQEIVNEEIATEDLIENNEPVIEDIQEESANNSFEDSHNISVNTVVENVDSLEKPTLINQSTSPRIPTPEPEKSEPCVIECAVPEEEKPVDVKPPTVSKTPSAIPVVSVEKTKKNENKPKVASNIPVMSYTPAYQNIDGTTVYQTSNTAAYSGTTYQQGPDGSVYAVPQSMVYAYPTQMDGEMQGYYMPVYDHTQQRDANSTLMQTAPTIYQPAGGATVMPVTAYSPATYGNSSLYQGQLLYSPDQYATSMPTGTSGQIQQYPLTTYPIGYPYPYNGYWSQPLTYYMPQSTLTNTSPIIQTNPPSLAGTNPNHISTSNNHINHFNVNNSNVHSGRKLRTTPPSQTNSGHNSQSGTPSTTTYQYASGVPLAISSDLNGPTMYAIPQTAVFPANSLPYVAPTIQSSSANAVAAASAAVAAAAVATAVTPTPTPVISTVTPQSKTNNVVCCQTVVSSNTSTASIETTSSATYSTPATQMNTNVSMNLSSVGKPHSAPSTPSSNPPKVLATTQRNPPLFSTPPLVVNSFNSTPMHSQYQNYNDSRNVNINYDKRNANGATNNNVTKKPLNSNSAVYIPSFRSTYQTNTQLNARKPANGNLETSNNANTTNAGSASASSSIRTQHINHTRRAGEKVYVNPSSGNGVVHNTGQNQPTNSNASVGGGTVNLNNSAQNNSEKPRTVVYRQKPGNVEYRKNGNNTNNSQRNSPSTNYESNNNSPNSIVSTPNASGTNISGFTNNEKRKSPPATTTYIKRTSHLNSYTPPHTTALASASEVTSVASGCHQPLLGTYNHHAGMYFKYGQTYFAHPTVTLNNRRSPPGELRPPLASLPGVYPTVNMMIPGKIFSPRQVHPRHPNPNYKGNKPSR